MRTQKLPPPPQPELTNGQMVGRTFLFVTGCVGLFRFAIYLGDTFYP